MKYLQLLFLLVISATLLFGQTDGEEIIAYDDGLPNLTLTFLEDGTFFITRFTPSTLPSVLTKLIFYVPDTSKGATFLFSIYTDVGGEPGTAILSSMPMSALTLGWNEIDITEFDIQVNGDFYFQLGYDLTSKFSIGAEDKEPISRRTWDTDC